MPVKKRGTQIMAMHRKRWGMTAVAILCLVAISAWAAPDEPDTRVLDRR